jgi:hypothetical protein
MMALQPAACCLTHFGRIDQPQTHVEMLRESIRAHVDIALAEESNDQDGREARLKNAVSALLVSAGVKHSGRSADDVARIFATDIELNAQGLGIWLARRAKRRSH